MKPKGNGKKTWVPSPTINLLIGLYICVTNTERHPNIKGQKDKKANLFKRLRKMGQFTHTQKQEGGGRERERNKNDPSQRRTNQCKLEKGKSQHRWNPAFIFCHTCNSEACDNASCQ